MAANSRIAPPSSLARRIARDEADVPRLKAQGDTLVLFTALLGISLAVSSMIGIRALYGGTGALLPALLSTAFFTFIVVGLLGPAGMRTSAERMVMIPTEHGRTVVMKPHKVEAVTEHHVAARRLLSWMLWLVAVPPWVVLFVCLFLPGTVGTPAEMPASLDVG